MSFSKPPEWTADGIGEKGRYDLWLRSVTAVILGTLLFNFFLAFVNTHGFGIRENHVVLSELLLIGCGLFLALSRGGGFLALVLIVFSYLAFILALRPELDLKAIRDILIPIVFYFLGRKLRRIEDADRIVLICAVIVVCVGLFEFLMLETFTSMVNIFDYYVARGTLAQDSNFVEGSTLFISSTRVSGRSFFAFLGNVRASSVFLEPVTMGNFGAFICLWALYRQDMKLRWLLLGLAFVVVVLGDARFGIFVCLAFILAFPFTKLLPRMIWWLVPFLIMLALVLYGGTVEGQRWEDNFSGRVVHSAQLMIKLDWASTFGVDGNLPFLDDNGYAYTISQIGIFGTLGLWTAFIFTSGARADGTRFKALATIFICLMMVVSNSFYSIKLAALFWLAAGAVDAPQASVIKRAALDTKGGVLKSTAMMRELLARPA